MKSVVNVNNLKGSIAKRKAFYVGNNRCDPQAVAPGTLAAAERRSEGNIRCYYLSATPDKEFCVHTRPATNRQYPGACQQWLKARNAPPKLFEKKPLLKSGLLPPP